MRNFYNISFGQLITLWVFGILLWLWAFFISQTSFLLILFIPFILIFYTLGWKNNYKRISSNFSGGVKTSEAPVLLSGILRKVVGGTVGVLSGYVTYIVVKYFFLLSGPFVLGPIGISGQRVATNLESIANILGFVAFIFILINIYRLIVRENIKNI